MNYQEEIAKLQKAQRDELTALAEKVVIVKKNRKSVIVEFDNGFVNRRFKCVQNDRGFWSASEDGRVWISGFYNDFKGLRVFIAKNA